MHPRTYSPAVTYAAAAAALARHWRRHHRGTGPSRQKTRLAWAVASCMFSEQQQQQQLLLEELQQIEQSEASSRGGGSSGGQDVRYSTRPSTLQGGVQLRGRGRIPLLRGERDLRM